MVEKSLEKYLQCFHVSRVYFFASLHQIFILEVFIILIKLQIFLATDIGDHLVALFFLQTHWRYISVGSKLLPTMSVKKAILYSLASKLSDSTAIP